MDTGIHDRNRARIIWRGIMWGGFAVLLSLPALAMSVGAEGVEWSASDFFIMGGLMALLGVAIELAMRLLRSWRTRMAAISGAVLVFIAIWVELAVGIFGTPFAGT